MKFSKKWLALLLTIVSTVCLALGLAACGGGKGGDDTITLKAPVVTLNDNVLSWGKVDNATYYLVYEGESTDGTIVTETSYTIVKTAPGSYVYTVAAFNSKADPKIGPKSEPVTYVVPEGGVDPDPGTDPDPDEPAQLNAPLAQIEGNAINWQPVPNAVSYEIYKNGDKIDTVVSFNSLGDDILPTTYTITDAASGDKFQVKAISGDSEKYEDSELSEEEEYTALGNTLSLTSSVYITDATKSVTVSADEPGHLYKVLIKANNNLAITAGHVGTDAIHVQGSPSNSSSPYGADAVLEDGVWSANIIITGDNTLYLTITTVFKEVSLGYTVSLAEPYEVEEGNDEGVVQTYQLETTGFVDVVIPYNIGGYRIKIELGESVPFSGNVLYIVLEDGSTNKTIYLQTGSDSATATTLSAMDGYYVSNTFGYGAGAIYLNSSSVDVKATISIEVPDVVYANIPDIEVDYPVYAVDVSNKEASPTQFKFSGVENGEYFLVVQTNIPSLVFYAKVDDGAYQTLDAVANIYSIKITVDDSKLISLYGVDKEMLYANYIALYKAENHSYFFSAEGEVEDALLGNSVDTATVFNLSNPEEGDYTLTIIGSASGLTFVVTVGEKIYTISTSENKYPKYLYTTEIKIEEETSLSIYLTDGIYVVDVTLTKIEEEELPELTHGGTGTKFTLVTQFGSNASQSFALKDVDDGTYTLALRGFIDGSYDDYNDISAIIGSKTVQLCTSGSGYSDDKQIKIEGEKELTVQIKNGNVTLNLTIYLLAEGESIEEGTGGTETSLSKSVSLEAYMYVDIDVSELQYGVYSIKLEGVTPDFLGNYPSFYASTDKGNQVEVPLIQGNDFTGEITITGALQIKEMDEATVTVKLEKIGDLPRDGLTVDTPVEVEITDGGYSLVFNVDLGNVEEGDYIITFTFSMDSPMSIYVTPENGTETGIYGQSGTISIPANCSKLTIQIGFFADEYPVTMTVTLAKA